MTIFHCDKISGLKPVILSECIQNTFNTNIEIRYFEISVQKLYFCSRYFQNAYFSNAHGNRYWHFRQYKHLKYLSLKSWSRVGFFGDICKFVDMGPLYLRSLSKNNFNYYCYQKKKSIFFSSFNCPYSMTFYQFELTITSSQLEPHKFLHFDMDLDHKTNFRKNLHKHVDHDIHNHQLCIVHKNFFRDSIKIMQVCKILIKQW